MRYIILVVAVSEKSLYDPKDNGNHYGEDPTAKRSPPVPPSPPPAYDNDK